MDFNRDITLIKNISNKYPLQGSDAWLKMRPLYVTGTKVTAAKKRRNVPMVLPGDSFIGNKYTEHGRYYEDICKQIYEQQYNDHVVELNFLPHPTCDIMACSPDGFSYRYNCLIEIKCPYSSDLITNLKPEHNDQIQHSLYILSKYGIETYCKYIVFDYKTLSIHVLDVKRDKNFWPTKYKDCRDYIEKVKENHRKIKELLS